jgi:hypothetical protein
MAVLTYSSLSTDYATAQAEIEQNFSDLSSRQINAADLADQSITSDKLTARYQEMMIMLGVRAADLAAGWPATTLLDAFALPGSAGDQAWTVTDIQWVCTDVGDGTGTGTIEYGYFDAAGTWQTLSTLDTFTLALATGGAGTDSTNSLVEVSGGSTEVAPGSEVRSIALVSGTANANTLSLAGSALRIGLRLTRPLQVA